MHVLADTILVALIYFIYITELSITHSSQPNNSDSLPYSNTNAFLNFLTVKIGWLQRAELCISSCIGNSLTSHLCFFFEKGFRGTCEEIEDQLEKDWEIPFLLTWLQLFDR